MMMKLCPVDRLLCMFLCRFVKPVERDYWPTAHHDINHGRLDTLHGTRL